MTVECPACKTRFPVDPNKVPAGGVHARCSECEEVFFVEAPTSETAWVDDTDVQVAEPETEAISAPPEVEPHVDEPSAPAEDLVEAVELPPAEEEEELPTFDEPQETVESYEAPSVEEPLPTFEAEEPETSVEVGEPSLGEVETPWDEPVEAPEEEAPVFEAEEPAQEELAADFEASEPLAEVAEPSPEEVTPAFETAEPTPEEAEPTFGEAEQTFSMDAAEPEAPVEEAPSLEEEPAFAEEAVEVPAEPEIEAPAFQAPVEPEPAPPVTPLPTPQFGKRDPKEKAQRLARVLVSDIILYNPDRHQRALEADRLKEEFDDEIQKSWAEYVEQVGEEIAKETDFFHEALNEILAKGRKVF